MDPTPGKRPQVGYFDNIDKRSDDLQFDAVDDIYNDLGRQPGSQQFRLITLLRSSRGSNDIECSLFSTTMVPFNDPSYIDYEALSYMWGDPQHRPHFARVNGKNIPITENLWSALKHVKTGARLWVDALCINQENTEERGQQVSLMPEIYKNASKVIIWLGVGSSINISLALKVLLKLRSESLRIDVILPRLKGSEWSDEQILEYLSARYRTNSDDQSYIMRLIKLISAEPEAWMLFEDSGDAFRLGRVSKPGEWRQYELEAIIHRCMEQGWTDDAVFNHMRDRYLNANGRYLAANAAIESIFWKRISEVRHSRQQGDGFVQEMLSRHSSGLPTEKALMSILPDVVNAAFKKDGDDNEDEDDRDAEYCVEFELDRRLRHQACLILRRFCALKYWSRLWVVQEILLARRLEIQTRDVTMEWETFADFVHCLKYTESQNSGRSALLYTPAAKLANLRSIYTAESRVSRSQKGISLSSILISCRHTHCHDPRDKVYGLLGLTSHTGLDLYPDYGRSTSEIYEALINNPKLYRSDRLIWFSSLLQEQLSGLPFDSPRSMSPTPLLKTKAKMDGSISILGDSFTTISNAKALIQDWQELYFHRILSYEPMRDLSITVCDALDRMGHDFQRVFDIQSTRSHARCLNPDVETPDYVWDPIQSRYSKYLMGKNCDECAVCSDFEKKRTDEHSRVSFSSTEVKHEHALPRWVIGTRGQIGLVPSAARDGDKICHFQASDVAVIIRACPERSDFYSIVGSGLMLKRWGEDDAQVYEDSDEIFHYSVGERGKLLGMKEDMASVMDFHLDMDTLRLLTYKPGM